jgi:glyoxylase-like metal-dependent hydrolase (beta-lactamase superfamily II)
MRIYPIETGNFKLDGGAMFGVVPKSIWNKNYPSDENNMIPMSARSLLIEHNKKLILIDCGLGNKQEDSFFKHYYLFGHETIDTSLAKYGFIADDITDVFLTHLHFDHVGGATIWNKDKTKIKPKFKNATYWTNKEQWKTALKPNPREQASFLTENLIPLQESEQLKFLNVPKDNYKFDTELGFDVLFLDGHTEKLMIPILKFDKKTIVFAGDLLPTVAHLPIPYVMSYDVRPLKTMKEKQKFLRIAHENNFILYFQHDAHTLFANLTDTEKGIRIKDKFTYSDLFF